MSFLAFAASHGLAIQRLIADGSIHRCPTTEKPRSDNGAYMLDHDRGWVMDWQQGDRVEWWNDPTAKPWTAEEKAAAERKRREQAKERARRMRQAAADALRMIGEAELLIPRPGRDWRPGRAAVEPIETHPYLVKKGFPAESCFVLDGEMLIPMFDCFDFSRPIGLQRIKPDGEKKYLHGQRAKGAVHRIGNESQKEIWMVEGYVDGLSVRAALKRMYRDANVVVCFSAGNLVYVASLLKTGFVYADNDESKVGESAAIDSGLPWTMSDTVGNDPNDDFLIHGVDYLCAKISEVTAL